MIGIWLTCVLRFVTFVLKKVYKNHEIQSRATPLTETDIVSHEHLPVFYSKTSILNAYRDISTPNRCNGPRGGRGRGRGDLKSWKSAIECHTSRSKNGLCTRKDKGLFRATMCRERAGGLPRTSNISSFVEPAKRKRKEKKIEGGEWIGRKREKYTYWKETRCKCIRWWSQRAKVCRRSVSISDRWLHIRTRRRNSRWRWITWLEIWG